MTPQLRITLDGLKAKSKAHDCQGHLLTLWGDLSQIDGKSPQVEVKFTRAYNAVDEVSRFPLDTTPEANADIDVDTFAMKAEAAVTKLVEFKVQMDATQGKPGDKAKLDDAKKLLDHAIALIMSAKDDVKGMVDTKPAAKGQELTAPPEA